MHKDKLLGYDYYKNGKRVDTVDAKNAAKAYENAFAIAEDRIDGLGESLATLIAQGDRDAIGKKGQNKAFLPTENGRFKFYGIDFGKAYRSKNPILASLKDDFSFKSPTAAVGDVYFSNYSILYDNPLRDKMKGIYLLAALRGKLTDPQKEQIAKEFEEKDPKDPHFAQKLRNMPKPGESPEEIINIEIKKYQDEK
ncbi:MAG: hypothetical protein AB7V32_08925, partial [Candidatus Berkiella sp.]